MVHKIKAVSRAYIPDEKTLHMISSKTDFDEEFLKYMIHKEGFKNSQYNGHFIGIGHNLGPKTKKKLKISDEQVYSLYLGDLMRGIDYLNKKTKNHYRSLDNGKKQALLDAYFTIGESIGNSDLVRDITDNKIEAAVAGFAKMVKARGKINSGTCIRRLDEIGMYGKFTPSGEVFDAIDAIAGKAHDPKVTKVAEATKERLKMGWLNKS